MPTSLLFTLMISFTVIANLLMKTGAMNTNSDSVLSFNWRILLGLACFGTAALIYVLILRRVPLAIAQAFASAQYIAVILGATFILGESMDARQWIGIVCIAAGILLVGMRNA